MINVYEVLEKNRLAYKHTLKPDDTRVKAVEAKISSDTLDFSSNIYRQFNGRLITQFDELSPENVIILHLKHELKRIFKVNFANRNKIIEELFDRLQIARSLHDFTIIKFDLRQYFYSVSTSYINQKYILPSPLSRIDKNYVDRLCASNPYCVAGLPIFNYFIEIISRDLDSAIKTRLMDYGLVYYTRYVDDGIIILNKYLCKKDVKQILDLAIEDVFNNKNSKNKVRVNHKKFAVINKRHLDSDQSFDFLGYEFFIKDGFSRFKVGLTKSKRDKYQDNINSLIKKHYIPGDPRSEMLVRHMIKAHSSRVVYCSSSGKNSGVWISKGIIANYNKLKDFPAYIHLDTRKFMRDIYRNAFRSSGHQAPHYLNNGRYNLYENLINNRAMIFNELIGMSKDQLLQELREIGDASKTKEDSYDRILRWYLISIRIGY